MNTHQPPKVRFTTIAGTEEGHLLTLFTVAGPKVEFLLDDLGLATLSLMLAPLIESASQRGQGSVENILLFRKDEVDE